MRAALVLAKIRALWGDSDGSALVEATIITPLLVSLFLGVLEFSWYFYNQQLVVAGLRDAARYMTRIELTNGNSDPCARRIRTASSTRPRPRARDHRPARRRRRGPGQRLECGRRHNQLPSKRRAQQRPLRRRLDKHDDH
jgi:hypothetical protein